LRWKESYTSLLFVAPAVVYVAIFSVVPTVQAVYGSFQTGITHWTLSNYNTLIFFGLNSAIVNTIVVSFGALGLQFVLAFIMAAIMISTFRGHRLFTVLAILPWGVATVVAAFSFSNIFMPTGGYANSLLQAIGMHPVNWYSTYPLQIFILIVSDSWKNTPIVALIILAGMSGISPEIYQAASMDGAGRVQRFFRITLPNLRNFIVIALVIRGISEFNIFALPLALVGTRPPLLTTLTYQFYSTTTTVGESYAAATVLLAFILAFAIVVMKMRRPT
jgi:trehalose transport system permease protein